VLLAASLCDPLVCQNNFSSLSSTAGNAVRSPPVLKPIRDRFQEKTGKLSDMPEKLIMPVDGITVFPSGNVNTCT
jgi:hypothetical protein